MKSSFVLCLVSSAFLLVDLTSHGQWHTCPVRCQAPCSGKFVWLGNHPSLANRTGAFVEVAIARCHYCFSKPCLLSPFVPGSLQQRQLPKNYIYNLGTANYQLPWSKLVLNGDCVVQKREAAKL